MKAITILSIVCFSTFGIASARTIPKSTDSTQSKPFIRLQLKLAEYCLGSVYSGSMAVQSGLRVESILMNGRLIPELQVHRDLVNVEKLTYGQKEVKPFMDFKAGIRYGKADRGKFKRLSCIDHAERSGNIVTTYYEEKTIYGDRNIGLAGGYYMSRSMINPFKKETEILGVSQFVTHNVYAGFSVTKMMNKKVKYASGNICYWDQYRYFYANALFCVNYSLEDSFHNAGFNYPVRNPQTPQTDNLRSFRRTGILIGYENGRKRRGFCGNYELGIIPALKGRGFFFKCGASYIFGY